MIRNWTEFEAVRLPIVLIFFFFFFFFFFCNTYTQIYGTHYKTLKTHNKQNWMGTSFIVYAHGRRLCSNRFRHGSTTINYPQCSLTFLCERYLHRCREQSFTIRAYAMSAVGIDVVRSHTKYCIRYHKIAECIARYKWMNGLCFYGVLIVFQPRNGIKPAPLIFAWNPPWRFKCRLLGYEVVYLISINYN